MPTGTFQLFCIKNGISTWRIGPVGTVSQGKSVEEVVANLKEATELYLEEFPPEDSSRPARYA